MPMTLTRIVLNRFHPQVRTDLGDRPGLHKTTMRLLTGPTGPTPRKTGGLLFRLEPGLDSVLLVQTADTPDLAALPKDYGTAATRDLTAMLNALAPGLAVHYRITASPSERRSAGVEPHPITGKRRGRLTELTGASAITWWERRAGLQLTGPITATPRPFPCPPGPRPFHKLTQFDGTATVTDPELLTAALLDGIGKGKPYGAGLLTLAPA
jgi:CRISPR system Cascade subunit CasE